MKEYTLKLKEAELNLVSKALGKLPFEEVYAVIQNISKQIKPTDESSPKKNS